MGSPFARLVLMVLLVASVAAPTSAQTGRVAGTVKDENGQPIKGATVVAENPQASPSTFTTTTDERGRWSIIGLRAGVWTFTAQAPGFVPSQGKARVQTLASNPPVDFTLARGATPPAGSALAGVDTKELQKDLEAAEALYTAGHYEEAIAAYRAILAKAPALTLVNLQIGNAYRQMKQLDRALEAYEQVLKAKPDDERAVVAIGMTSLEKGDLDTAETMLANAAAARGASREVFYALGEVKFARNQPDEAARWYARAHEADPNWGKPLFKLGLVALNRGDKIEAAKFFERLLAVDPASPEAAQAQAVLEQLKP
jgi:tetratricopeptide (TPR) repeat protein